MGSAASYLLKIDQPMGWLWKKLNKTTLAIALAVGSIASANATTVIYESFSDSDGTLDGNTPGTGLSGTWTSTGATVTSPTLTYGDLPNAGGQANTAGNDTISYITTSALFDAGLLTDGATLWFSFMTSGATGSGNHSGFGLGTTNVKSAFNGLNMAGDGIGFYKRDGKATGWKDGAKSAFSDSIGISTGAELIVGKVVWGAGAASETITIYNPSTTGPITQPLTFVSTTVDGFDQTALNTISFSSRGGDQVWDEIRFGDSFESVVTAVPEPSSTALLGLGGLALILRRRK